MKLLIIFLLFLNLYAKPLEKVTLQLQWKHQFEFAGFYIAKEKGYYKDVGLDVEFKEFDTNINIIDSVLNTPNMYGITYSNLISEYLKGKPLVFIANFFKQSPLAIVASKDIELPIDLKDKKVMGVGENIHSAMMLVMFKKFGLSVKDFISIPHSFDVKDFIDKKVDAMVVYTTNETFALDKLQIPYNLLDPSIYGAEFYDVNLFTSQKELQLHPNRVKNFKNASIKGWKYALNHIDETINIILKKYNSQHKSKEALEYEAKQIKTLMLTNLYKIGSIDINRVKLIADNFKDLGLISKDIYTDFDKFIFKENHYYIQLTHSELDYLQKHSVIKVHNEQDWTPYNFNTKGTAQGFSIDYMNLLASKIGLKVKYISGYTWEEFLNMIKHNKIDVMLNIAKTTNREKYLAYTSPYLDTVYTMIVKDTHNRYKKLSDFDGKTIAVVKGFYEEEMLKKYYPNINLLLVDNTTECLKAVIFNKAHGTLNTLGVAQYLIAKYQISGLKTAFEIKDKRFDLKLHLATNKNNTILRDILEKGKAQITQEEIIKLREKWFSIEKDKINYTIILSVIGVIGLISLLIVIWNIKLNQKVNKEIAKNKEQESLLHYYSKQESMKNMVGNISHQWKHPLSELSSTLMFLDTKIVLDQNISKDEMKTITKKSKNIIEFMSQTIDTFNNFYSKSSQNSEKLFFITEAIEETLFILKGSIETNNITIKKDLDQSLQIYGNINQLEQVLLSILVNAIDIFIKREIKNPQITIATYQKEHNIFIEIIDNAKGIKLKNIDDIFKISTTNKNSTGLGLFISKNIIETKFNGFITAYNTEQGAKFSISFR